MRPAVLILAGGEGRRIGGSKPLRRLGGRTLIERALEKARGWSDRIAIAARDPGQVGAVGVPVLIDQPSLEGPLAALFSACQMDRPAVLTIACDTPFLPDDLMERLEAALGDKGAALAASEGRVHPACALWRVSQLERLPAYAASGRRSLIGFAETIGHARVDWPSGLFLNINRPEDLAEAEKRLRQAGSCSSWTGRTGSGRSEQE